MKQILFTLSLIILLYAQSFSQGFNEYYFKFKINDNTELNKITQIISIDNVSNNEVYAYANDSELENFQKLGYKIEYLQKDIPKSLTMATTVAEMANWNRYPTYEVYRQMMKDFETNHPSICKLDSIGTTVNGRKLYCLKITDNINTEEDEPEFFYTSTMHGDETTGYILMLRLIDSLLTSYSSSAEVENLINNIDIYINPNANPDGTYYGGNQTVSSARRYNANGYDLNRNFPDPRTGNGSNQPEIQSMMDFAEEHHFTMSGNFHGGAAVMNYPWDTWYLSENKHADTDWFEQICTDYVATARTINSSYMNDVASDGVTHGATWYKIDGGRQDYMNYWHQCREVTIELSVSKLLATESLNNYWNYNKQSLLDYMEECLYGIRGVVTDKYNTPLDAMIWIKDHDELNDSSMVFTDPDIGNYHRLIAPGTYDIIASTKDYPNDTIKGVVVSKQQTSIVNFKFGADQDSISLIASPEYIKDTLFFDQINTHDIIISNESTASSTNYSIEIENESTNPWISINKYSETLIENKNDTVVVTLNTDLLNAGIYNTNIILTSADSETTTIPINLFVQDTISTQITPETITDELWGGDKQTYKVNISNNGLLSLNYSISVQDETNNKWISLSQTTGSLSITESDIIDVSVDTETYGFGNFNTNIIIEKENSTNDTIPVSIFVKDTISFEITPITLTDTIELDSIASYDFTVTNTGNGTIKYTAALDFSSKSDWISLENSSNQVSVGNSETVIANVNSTDLTSGDYSCTLNIFESNGKSYSIPIKIHVSIAQSIINFSEFALTKAYPNPFSDKIYLDIESTNISTVDICIYNVCGTLLHRIEVSSSGHPILLNDYVDIQGLNKGVYFIQSSTAKKQSTIKVIKH